METKIQWDKEVLGDWDKANFQTFSKIIINYLISTELLSYVCCLLIK